MAKRLWIAGLMTAALAAPSFAPASDLSPHQIAMLSGGDLPSTLPPSAIAAAAPVLDDLHRVRLEQARLPPPRTDAERLVRMGALDRAAREGIAQIRWTSLAESDARAAMAIISTEMDDVDTVNQHQLFAMLPPEGWFGERRYGREASEAAFTIVQHADLATQQRFLPTIQAFVLRGDADPGDFTRMFDRVAMRQGRSQRYGTQFTCVDHRWTPYRIENQDRVEALRASLHMSETFAQTMARMAASDCR